MKKKYIKQSKRKTMSSNIDVIVNLFRFSVKSTKPKADVTVEF